MTETPFDEQRMLAEAAHLGLKVRVCHVRNLRGGGQATSGMLRRHRGLREIESRGGVTTVVLANAQGRNFAQGIAHCSKHDNYCKATGRRIALHRALYGMVPIAPLELSA